MKSPSSYLWFWAICLVGGAVYLAIGIRGAAPYFQFARAGQAVVLTVIAGLLLIRFRWSPELVAAVAVFSCFGH
jgi:hypothetical protein